MKQLLFVLTLLCIYSCSNSDGIENTEISAETRSQTLLTQNQTDYWFDINGYRILQQPIPNPFPPDPIPLIIICETLHGTEACYAIHGAEACDEVTCSPCNNEDGSGGANSDGCCCFESDL